MSVGNSVGLASSALDHLGSPVDPLLGRVLKLFSIRRNIAISSGASESVESAMSSMMSEVGLLVLLGGSKSAKLDRAFRSISYAMVGTANDLDNEADDDTNDLALPLVGLKVMLEAFLTSIIACVESSTQLEVEEASNLIDSVASHAVTLISEYLGDAESPVSFNDFGAWYNDGGFKDCPWLELLDLRKWTTTTDSEEEGLPPPPSYAGVVKREEGDDAVVVSFDFPTSKENPVPLSISITKADLRVLSSAVTESTLLELAPPEIINVLSSLCTQDNKLSYSVIARLAHSLYPTSHPADRRRDLILTHFSLLDPKESGVLAFEDVAAGFTFFCGGNKVRDGLLYGIQKPAPLMRLQQKTLYSSRSRFAPSQSEKLAAAFELFKPSASAGGLGKRSLWRFLRSFLSALVSVSMVTNNRDPEEMYDPVDHSAVWTASLIFDYVEKSGRQANADEVDFEEFADWYTNGAGFKAAPWLELLDLKKLLGLQYDGAEEEEEEYEEVRELCRGAQPKERGFGGRFTALN